MPNNETDKRRRIMCSSPAFLGNELEYLTDAIERGWITAGKYVDCLEIRFAKMIGRKYALTCNSGTAALHLAMLGRGVKPGDCIIVPALTYVATANAVRYCGAEPIFADVDRRTWCLDPSSVADKVKRLRLEGRRLTGCIAVHLYNAVADIDAIRTALPEHVWLVEDAAQAMGAAMPGDRAVGTESEIATFSLYGSKTITAGEGGLVVTDEDIAYEVMALYRGQGWHPKQRRYEHMAVGYNYRMSDLAAAVAVAQLEQLDYKLAARHVTVMQYRELLKRIDGLEVQETLEGSVPGAWAMSVILPRGCDRDRIGERLEDAGIETRPTFTPVPMLEAYEKYKAAVPISAQIGRRGLTLPTHEQLTSSDIERVVAELATAIAEERSRS